MERCAYCGSGLVLDPANHEWVCPDCGVVYGFEAVPSYQQLTGSSVYIFRSTPRRAAAISEAYSRLPPELAKLLEGEDPEVVEAAEAIVFAEEFRVSPRALRRLVEAGLVGRGELLAARERAVRAELERLCREVGCDPQEAWNLAERLRTLWSGRSSRVVAQAFAYASAVLSGRAPRPGAVSYRAKKLAETIIAMAGGPAGPATGAFHQLH